ncbi:MAG: hypothetical protein AAGB97_09350 [Dehalococcoidia bacterium]
MARWPKASIFQYETCSRAYLLVWIGGCQKEPGYKRLGKRSADPDTGAAGVSLDGDEHCPSDGDENSDPLKVV